MFIDRIVCGRKGCGMGRLVIGSGYVRHEVGASRFSSVRKRAGVLKCVLG